MHSSHHGDPRKSSEPETRQKKAWQQVIPASLTRSAIILDLKSQTLEEAIGELVPCALHGAGPIISKSKAITKLIQKRLKSSEPDLQSGVAFIPSRIPKLTSAKVALGVAPEGLRGTPPNREHVYAVFLSLLPEGYSGPEIPVWAKRRLSDKKKLYQLKTAPDLNTVLNILKED